MFLHANCALPKVTKRFFLHHIAGTRTEKPISVSSSSFMFAIVNYANHVDLWNRQCYRDRDTEMPKKKVFVRFVCATTKPRGVLVGVDDEASTEQWKARRSATPPRCARCYVIVARKFIVLREYHFPLKAAVIIAAFKSSRNRQFAISMRRDPSGFN